MKFDVIPGRESFDIETIILDLNGTLSVGGEIVEGVKPRLSELQDLGYKVLFLSGDTRGDAAEVADDLGIGWKLAKTAEDKRNLAMNMNPETCASIGNGLIDLELTKAVKLGIVTMQAEGIHVRTLLCSDLVVPTINDGLDLFIEPPRLIASLRR